MRDYKTIKTRPREVRGRVMHVAGKASSGAAYFSADRLRERVQFMLDGGEVATTRPVNLAHLHR